MLPIHKEVTGSKIKDLIERSVKREIKLHYVLEILGIKRSRVMNVAINSGIGEGILQSFYPLADNNLTIYIISIFFSSNILVRDFI